MSEPGPFARVRRRAAATALSATALSAAGIALMLAACSTARGAPPASAVAPSSSVAPRTVGDWPRGSYVALGDSYTAGPDIPDSTGAVAGCGQSDASYPYLVARRLRLALTDVSCGGATIADLSAAQSTGHGTNPAQFSDLSKATALVTLGIGGNDIGWSGIIARCVEPDLIPALLPGGATPDGTPGAT